MTKKWYVRKDDGTVYGPADDAQLISWAQDGRVGSGDEVSEDQESWTAAPLLQILDMVWKIYLDDDLVFGPFNVYALIELAEKMNLSYAADTLHVPTGKRCSLGDVLMPLLLSERTSMIEVARKKAARELSDAQTEIESLREALTARERDLERMASPLQDTISEGFSSGGPGPLPMNPEFKGSADEAPSGEYSRAAIEKLKDELASARGAIRNRDDEITRLRSEIGLGPGDLMREPNSKSRPAEPPVEHPEMEPQSQLPLPSAFGEVRREAIKDSQKKAQAVAAYRRQRAASRHGQSLRDSSTHSRRK